MAASKLSRRHTFPSSLILFLTAILLSSIQKVDAVRCYTCTNAATNEECNQPHHIQDCKEISPPAMEYDTCQTKMIHTEETGIQITKRCVRGPCSLAGNQNVALGLDCDRGASTWECEACCSEDECNVSHASSISARIASVVLPLLSLIGITRAYMFF